MDQTERANAQVAAAQQTTREFAAFARVPGSSEVRDLDLLS